MSNRVTLVTLAVLAALVPATPRADAQYAAPLPHPLIKTHFNTGKDKYLFTSRDQDLKRIKEAFNGVIVDAGDPKLVDDVREAGLAAIVEFDKKDDFAAGKSVDATVDKVIAQVKAHPGSVAMIRVADRVNQRLTPQQALDYLAATGGVFHKEIPGVPVVVDVEDWELTCGMPGQTSCSAHRSDEYQYCVDDVLKRIYASGNVDGFEVACNLKDNDVQAMVAAMRRARAMFPAPFLLYARAAELSFKEDAYPGDDSHAARQVQAYVATPLAEHLDGIDLWAWHRPWKTELRTFLNKDGGTNPLWKAMTQAYQGAVATNAPAK